MKKISIVILAIFLGGFTLTSHAQTSHAETLPQQDSVKDVSNEPQTAAYYLSTTQNSWEPHFSLLLP